MNEGMSEQITTDLCSGAHAAFESHPCVLV